MTADDAEPTAQKPPPPALSGRSPIDLPPRSDAELQRERPADMTPEELLRAIFGEQPEDGPCECACAGCGEGHHCDRASCAQPG